MSVSFISLSKLRVNCSWKILKMASTNGSIPQNRGESSGTFQRQITARSQGTETQESHGMSDEAYYSFVAFFVLVIIIKIGKNKFNFSCNFPVGWMIVRKHTYFLSFVKSPAITPCTIYRVLIWKIDKTMHLVESWYYYLTSTIQKDSFKLDISNYIL